MANYRRKCTDFYGELISAVQIVPEEMGIPLTSQRTVPISALTPGFVGTVYEIAGKLISRYGGSGSYSSGPDPFGATNGLLQLSYGIPIAFVMPGEMELVEDSHRKLCASLDDARSPKLIPR